MYLQYGIMEKNDGTDELTAMRDVQGTGCKMYGTVLERSKSRGNGKGQLQIYEEREIGKGLQGSMV